MTFDQWMKYKNHKYRKTDDSMNLRLLREAWETATIFEREECAKVCDVRAARTNDGNWSEKEWETLCGSNELAADAIRMRSNVELTGSALLRSPGSTTG